MDDGLLKLYTAIKKSGLTQGEVIRKAELQSETRLSRILKGFSKPTEIEVIKICSALKIKRKDLDSLETLGR